jgi:sugar phosphate permease
MLAAPMQSEAPMTIEETNARSASRLRALKARVFGLTWLSYASYYLTRKNFSVVKSRLEGELHVSVGTLGAIDTVYLATYALGQFVNGALGDRFGARRMLGFGMLGTAALSWLFGLSSTAAVFLLAFGVNGLFQSTGWPNNVKAMAPWFTRRTRGRVMGIWCTNYQVGGLVATALATWLLVNVGWRSTFLVPGVWVAAVGAAVLLFLVERPQDRGLPAQDTDRHEGAEAAATGPAFRSMLRVPAVWALGGAYFGLKLIRYSLLFWLPYYLHTALGYDEGAAGYLSTSFEVGGIVGAVATGWVSDRWFPERRALLTAPMIFALAFALWLYQAVGDIGMVPNALAMALVGFLLFGPDALISGAAAQDLGGGRAAASAAGIINGLGSIGAILQGSLTATVSATWGWNALFWVFVVLALVSGFALLPLALRRR